MAQFREWFQKTLLRAQLYWEPLSLTKKLAFAGIVLGSLAIFSVFLLYQKKETHDYLFVNISPEDSLAIADLLKKQNVHDFILDPKGVKVPTSEIDRLRVLVSSEGLPHKGSIGWEKFDEDSFTRTDFEQEIQRLRAIQGELSRTISSMQGVHSARVHIVLPKQSVFIRDQKKPTASIYIKTKPGQDLERKQIKGIQTLVSKAVEGLNPNDVVIIGAEGSLVSETEPEDEASQQSREMLKYKRSVEKSFEDRIQSIVGKIVGPDRVESKVDVEVDFTQEKQTISDVDPDDNVVVSKNTSGFSMEGQGLNPTGIPGSKSNVPGEQEDVSASQSKAGSKRDTELVNYEFTKVVSQRILPVGKINRLTVSAIVDGKQIYPMDGSTPEFQPRTEEEMKKIEEIIKNAVGFRENRDAITVQNMMFQLDPFQRIEISNKKKEDREYLSTLAISAVLALAILFFFLFIVRPYIRWLAYDPEKKEREKSIQEYKPDLELGRMQDLKIQEDVPFDKMSPKDQVLYIAKHEPKRTTEAIRMMLSPNNHQG